MLAICKPLCRRLYLHFLFSFHLWSSYRPLYKSSHCRQSHLPTKKGVLLRHDSRQVVHKAPPAQHRWHPSPTGTSLEPAPCDPHGGSLLPVAPPLRAAVLAPSYFFRRSDPHADADPLPASYQSFSISEPYSFIPTSDDLPRVIRLARPSRIIYHTVQSLVGSYKDSSPIFNFVPAFLLRLY